MCYIDKINEVCKIVNNITKVDKKSKTEKRRNSLKDSNFLSEPFRSPFFMEGSGETN